MKFKTFMFKATYMTNCTKKFRQYILRLCTKYNTLMMDTLRKYEKLKITIRRTELHFTFLTYCQILNAYPKF